jgi:hypothetical protein
MVRYVNGHQVIAAVYLTKQSEKNESTTLKLPSNTHVIMFDSLLEGKEFPRNGQNSLLIWTAPPRGSSWMMYFGREW